MEHVCDCEENFIVAKARIEIFYEKYKQYVQHKAIDYETQTAEDDLEKLLDYISKGVDKKLQVLDMLTKSTCSLHQKSIDDLNSLIGIYNKYKDCYFKEKSERRKNRPTYTDDTNDTDAQSNNLSSYILEEEIKYRDYQENEETKKEYIKVKSQIVNLSNTISQEIAKGSETLEEIEDNVEKTNEAILRTNEELRQAALINNKKNTVKYPVIMGSILGVVGSIVPGIGNIVGATIGASLGLTIAKVQKKCIESVEPEKYKK
jgi:hypothetical protein